ncbi:MAG: response regulator transcription factor [Bacteroidetes bacterium]|nr:response regulator transcription factor [Bacteroidota bacterium]
MNAIVIDDDDLSGKVIAQYVSRSGFLELSGIFRDPAKALSFLALNKTDLIFLDVEMPGMNGLEFIHALSDPSQKIILVTSHTEFAVQAFEHHVLDFLVKPVSYARFFNAVSAVKDRMRHNEVQEMDEDIVFIKKDRLMVRIRKSEILWAEARGDYVILNTPKDRFIVHCTLKAIEEKLPARSHLRVHRSFIVKVDEIEKIEDNLISFSKQVIPIGKSYREEVFRKLKPL